MLTYKFWLIFMEMKQKKIFFEKKVQNGRLKKTLPILNIYSWEFQGLVLGLVELIDAKGINVA